MEIKHLPTSWIETTFGEVILSASNGIGGKQNKEGIGIAVSRIETIAEQTIDFGRVGYLENYDEEKIQKHFLNSGDILFSHINSPIHLGKTALFTSEKPLYHGINLLRIIVNQSVISPTIFNYFCKLTRFKGEFSIRAQHAVNQSSINQKKLASFEIALPPLAEQKQIATQLDDLLAQVERIKTRLDAIPNILKRFRQSVLAAAVSGRLTEEWNNKNKSTKWSKKGFSDLGELSRGKSKHRPRNDPKLFGNEHPFIQTGEVANSGGLISKATKFYSDFGLAQSRLFPKETLCITIAANIADTAILKIDACFPDSVVGFLPNKSVCKVEFIKFLIDTNKDNLESFAPATAQKNINLKVLNSLIFPIPSLEEQTQIVQLVEKLFTFAEQIEQRLKTAQSLVDQLTQSILAKAFRGELTAKWREQNPDLISGENSAQALLDKIKAEMEKLKPVKKTRKKK